MGTDLIESLRSWGGGEQLAEEQEFIILKREGYDPDPKLYPKKYKKLDMIIEGSSTRVRDRIKEQLEKQKKLNLGINGLTTNSVIKYIVANELYNSSAQHVVQNGCTVYNVNLKYN